MSFMPLIFELSVGYLTKADIAPQVENLVALPDAGLLNASDTDAESSATNNTMDASGEPMVVDPFHLACL